jgi:pimeloyl-ACP methyl ester carboxylesterase
MTSDAMTRISPLQIDVSRAAELDEQCTLAGTLFVPRTIAQPPILCVMFPGGTYTRNYHHLVVPGRTGYSAAEFLAETGVIVATLDHLGTGQSTGPKDGTRVTLEIMARCNAQATEWLRQAAEKGTLAPGLSAQPNIFVAGFGHSLGGYLLQIEQGEFGAFDAVTIAGSPCQAMKVAGESQVPQREIRPAPAKGYFLMPRAQNHSNFYYPDVPPDVIAADDLSFSALPEGMMDIGIPGRTAGYAGKIACPIFLAFGEIDLSPDPFAEPTFYHSARDITLFRLPRSAHCHNSASTRHLLWQRHRDWLRSIIS